MSTFSDSPIAAMPKSGGMLEVAAQREIAQVQAAMIMARRFPRDVRTAIDRIVMACARPELAEVALYTYARGGTDITGPSIRMAEAIAQNWGNIDFGIRELEQKNGESTIEAFALDLETNTRQVKVFQVPHVRYTRNGGRTALDDPRDVYEVAASQGARRLRACILGIIPGDVVEAAVRQVETTLKSKQEATPERIKAMLERFAEFGVTKTMIERRIQRSIEAITPALLVDLGKKFNSLKDGMSQTVDWFDPDPETTNGAPAPTSRTESVKDQIKQQTAPPAPKEGQSEAAAVGEGAPSASPEPAAGSSDDDVIFDGGDAEPKPEKIRRLLTARKMLDAEDTLEIRQRPAEKWGLPVGKWKIHQLVTAGFADKMLAMLESQ